MAFSLNQLKRYCQAKPKVTADFPFDETVLVFRVNGKIFCLVPLDETPLQFNLKCDPTLAELLRKKYSAVTPGYHMNKRHWNTIVIDGSIPVAEIKAMIDDSYELVAPKKKNL